ncbi:MULTISPECIES: chemoreceptor glutamine deamidase CheD [unclassified Paludibacterium]|uniref:chemoreceptor glutamine deamidase CheD n=1 Tax=unclassified Paludibacterium TaxID=2618429 RepID=UPI001C053070|nr:chemoreceptor glutamine deamidase CheD [Paludibacterium sp. B53371]BEV71891.1 chemoreceptor glutamine deamidase CheD [Paludibacterium sp. THUN1379]
MSHNGHGLDYFDQQFRLPAIKLLPGDYVATQDDRLLVTVLGSCVAACLRDPASGVCGMNHFMLPESRSVSAADSLSSRFGIQAMELLITDMQKRGARRDRLQAKVFGAGKVLDGMNVVNVGELNAAFVRSYLDLERIPIVASDLLGETARKVYFFTDSGKVMIRRLNTEKVAKLAVREKQYRDSIVQEESQSGSIDLFD